MRLSAAYFAIIAIWSTTPLAIKWSTESMSFISAIGLRMGLACLVCGLFMLLRRQSLPMNTAALASYGAALIGVFGAMSSVYWAVQFISSGLISVVFGLAPVFSGVLARPLLGEQAFSPGKLLALFLSFAGLAVVFGGEMSVDAAALPGLMAVSLGTVLFALSGVLVKRTAARMDPLAHTTGTLLLSLPFFFLGWLWLDAGSLPQPDLRGMLSVAYLAVVGSALGFVLYVFVLQRMTATRVALIPLITPVFALMIGAWLADELIAPTTLAGAALILCGLAAYMFADRSLNAMIHRRDRVEKNV